MRYARRVRHRPAHRRAPPRAQRRPAARRCRRPTGRELLYFDDGHYPRSTWRRWTSRNVTERRAGRVRRHRGRPQRRASRRRRRSAGRRTASAVLLSDNWDMWRVPGRRRRAAANLTRRRQEGRHALPAARRRSTRARAGHRPRASRSTSRLYGEWTKKERHGARGPAAAGGATTLLLGRRGATPSRRARDADVFVFTPRRR